ncbi:MAG: CNNM domain-containing protein [Candidatus Paceibacterota bacterium]
MEYLLSAILIAFSALFSGLTLGFFSLNPHNLERQAKNGNKEALAIYPLRSKGNLLLTTLLLGNVGVNTALSIYLGSLVSGVLAGFIATSLIFVFGEILPQATMSRHAMWYCSRLAPLMRVIMFLLLPITYPIAFILDKLLGKEVPVLYSKSELMQIVSELEDSEHSDIDADEERIIHGALQFSHTMVRDIMTPKEEVISYDEHQRYDDEFIKILSESNFSRYPIYSGNKENIVGILFTKDLINEDQDTAICDTKEAFVKDFLEVRPGQRLDTVLTMMLKRRQHMGVVMTKNKQFLGVITLEDIIEVIIQSEINDEGDEDED